MFDDSRTTGQQQLLLFPMVSKVIVIVECSRRPQKVHRSWCIILLTLNGVNTFIAPLTYTGSKGLATKKKAAAALWLFVVALLTGCTVLSSPPHPRFHRFSDTASARHKA